MSNLQLYAVTASGPCPLPITEAASDFLDLYQGMKPGVYTVLRTYSHNKFLHLDDHLTRTKRSMQLLGWRYRLDEPGLRQAIHTICTAAPFDEMRVRIDVLAAPVAACGESTRVLVGLMAFTPLPAPLYNKGVSVGFAGALARDNPQVKAADFAIRRRKQPAQPTYHELLMVNTHGEILEGISSNFYGVRLGRLYTAGQGVLEGVTRRVILDLATAAAIPTCLTPVRADEVGQLDEAAISSSSRGLLPVVRIGEQRIGTGDPGPICRRLMAAYDAYVASAIRTAVDTSP
ncbi:MAG: aminotransferase class IV [Caldilineaceae bacterium]|nr:aminotransferase class IV [Caldilineaceae bacterium]